MKYRRAEAANLCMVAQEYELNGADYMKNLDLVMRDCNGIGADWMPYTMTQLCTKLNPVMEVPAAIHDRMYAEGVSRNAADLDFLTNTIIVIRKTYGWWNPLRYIMVRRAVRYYTYLQLFGDKAWKDAQKR